MERLEFSHTLFFRPLNTEAALAIRAFISEDKDESDDNILPRYLKEETVSFYMEDR